MKEKFIRQIQHGMLGVLDQRQQEMLKAVIVLIFKPSEET